MKFFAVSEALPAEKWRNRFTETWPRYRDWYLSEGVGSRPTVEEARIAIAAHMPELLPLYDRVCRLVSSDEIAQRALSLFRTPPIISGCSVAIAPSSEPILVRNYDFTPEFFEGTILHSQWLDHDVLATSEAWIGCLDGLNSKGLAVALTFGGRLAHGREGFQTPLLLRYALETCSTITEAIKTLERLPAQTVSNVVLLDRSGDYAVAFLSPDRPMVVRKRAVTTNHQLALEWPEGNSWSETAERADLLDRLRATTPDLATFVSAFHQLPLYRTAYSEGLGTLYTVMIRPASGVVEYSWPQENPWKHRIGNFLEGVRELPIKSF